MPPAHILNAPTRLMKELGYGRGYQDDPDTPEGFSGADYFPEGMERERLYRPTTQGYERVVGDRLAAWEHLRTHKRLQEQHDRDQEDRAAVAREATDEGPGAQ